MSQRRYIVVLAHQYQHFTINERLWVTMKIVTHGPFHTIDTATRFAAKAAEEAPRLRWSLGLNGEVEQTSEQAQWVVDNGDNRRTVVTVERLRPAGIRLAWASIRTWLRDTPLRPHAGRKAA